MDASRNGYVCSSGDGDQRVLYYVFVDDSKVISFSTREVMEEMQAILLHKTRAPAGQDVLKIEEKLKRY